MLFGKDLLYRLEFKFRRYAVRNLMTIIVFGMAAVFILEMFMPAMGLTLAFNLVFVKTLIAQGQIWRLISFIFIPPPAGSEIFIILAIYFYWFIGQMLENEWGSFKFNVFYITGIIGTILSGLITGFAINYYLNMSLFFAFAILYPNLQLRLFFLIPIKAKYLGYLNAALFLYDLITVNWQAKVALLVALLNIALFFGGDFINMLKQAYRRAKWKRDAGGWFK